MMCTPSLSAQSGACRTWGSQIREQVTSPLGMNVGLSPGVSGPGEATGDGVRIEHRSKPPCSGSAAVRLSQ